MPAWIRLSAILISATLVFLAAQHAGDRDRGPGPSSEAKDLPAPILDPAARAAGADENWWQAASAEIVRSEYHASANAEGLQAPNRAHNLRMYFDKEGIAVVPRAGEAAAAWRFAWTTSRFGRPGVLRAVAAAKPEANGSRVTYRRAELDEWYENSARGLEQGFTVHAAPPGEGPLTIAGRIAGALRAELSADGGAVDLFAGHGEQVLRYAELHVWDAHGDEVPARLHLDGTELAILVEDGGAAYPLTVDPLLSTQVWGARGHQAGAYFGSSVATAGDVNGDGFSDVIVGAAGYDNGEIDEGRAFVYHGSGSGLATKPAPPPGCRSSASPQDAAAAGQSGRPGGGAIARSAESCIIAHARPSVEGKQLSIPRQPKRRILT